MPIIKKGWILYSNYRRKHNLIHGNMYRRWDKLDDKFKYDLTPESDKPTWVILEKEADKVLLKKKER